jgi:putative Mg2+ transporter-C (MgtC) family protein
MDVTSAPANLVDLFVRLALATGLGAAIGINREILFKPAGMRTHALVSLGSSLATILGMLLSEPSTNDSTAPGRIVQGIVAGIGFIGAGVILHNREARTVYGLTTAASIWIVSVAGMAVGAGLWRSAAIAVGLALLVLTLGRPAERAIHRAAGADDDE